MGYFENYFVDDERVPKTIVRRQNMDRREALKTVGAVGAVTLLPTITLAEPQKELCGWMTRWKRKNSDFWSYEFWQGNLEGMDAKENAENYGKDMKRKFEQFPEHRIEYEIFPVYR